MQSTDKFFTISQSIWGNLIKNKSLNLNDTVDYLIQCQRGLGCGDKHSVVDSDKNSAKFITVNNSCMGVTCITAGMWSTPALGEQ